MTTTDPKLPARRAPREEVLPAVPEFEAAENPEVLHDMLELAQENLGGANFNVVNLQKIKADKSGFFQIETAEGPQSDRTLHVIIMANRQARLYWGRNYNPGQTKEPPACTSNDGFTGVGDPGGPCMRCPYSKFKTARNPDGSQGAGQACKELRQLLVLLPGHMMPHLLNISPTSVKTFDKYTMTVGSGGANYWNVITKLAIDVTPSSGYPTAHVLFTLKQRLTPEQKKLLRPYHEKMRELLTPMTVDASAYEMTGEGDGPLVSKPRNYQPPPEEKDANPDDVPF